MSEAGSEHETDADVVAGVPASDVAVPDAVRTLAGPRPIRAVWRNELGGLTFALGVEPDQVFVKWRPAPAGDAFAAEAARLTWAVRNRPVPRLLQRGADERGSWLVTAAVPGQNAVAPRWRAEPARACAAIGSGLRAFHDAMPVAACPYQWSIESRRQVVAARGRRRPADRHPDHRGLDFDDALARLADPPPIDRLVVCHGDACAPNTLLAEDGSCSGHVDLGAMGRADRWADLAIATWSTQWNYGPGWEAAVLDAYGIAADAERTAYYRLLWDLSP
jgi:kanamycin kinase